MKVDAQIIRWRKFRKHRADAFKTAPEASRSDEDTSLRGEAILNPFAPSKGK